MYFSGLLINICVTGNLWQIMALCFERCEKLKTMHECPFCSYVAVVRPFSERVNANYLPAGRITKLIMAIAVLLNAPTYIAEHVIEPCVDVLTMRDNIQINKREFANNVYYVTGENIPYYIEVYVIELFPAALRLVPDFFFRCPLPFVVVAFLTVRTLAVIKVLKRESHRPGNHSRASISSYTTRRNRQISIMLTVSTFF